MTRPSSPSSPARATVLLNESQRVTETQITQSGRRSSRWAWTGPPVVYLGSLATLALNQIANRLAETFLSYAMIQFLVFAIPVAIVLFYVRGVEKEGLCASTGFRRVAWSKAVAFALALNFLSFIMSTVLFSAGEYLTPRLPDAVKYDPTAVQAAFQSLPRPAYWYMIFTSIVYAGFGEEFIFRGYILTRLLRKGSFFAVLTSALMWSSLHLWYLPTLGSTGIWQHLDVILTGLLFGTVYVRTKNILPFIAVHAYADILLPLSFLYPGGTVDLVAFIVLISGLIAVAGLTIHCVYKRFLRTMRPSSNQVGSLDPDLNSSSGRYSMEAQMSWIAPRALEMERI